MSKEERAPYSFKGDNAKLVDSIKSLLALDSKGALVPNGVCGLARQLLESAAERLGVERQPVCSHEWTDDGQFLLICTKCGEQENHDPKWRDMETAPKDGTLVRLLVEFEDHSTEDETEAPTIGANNFDNDEQDEWLFAGWCWTHDHWTQGKGTPIGWLPMIDTTSPELAELQATIERLRAELETLRQQHAEQSCVFCNDSGELLTEVKALRANLAEAHALFADVLSIDVPRTAQSLERMRSILSGSAELAPIAWHVGGNGYDEVAFDYPAWVSSLGNDRPAINAINDVSTLAILFRGGSTVSKDRAEPTNKESAQ